MCVCVCVGILKWQLNKSIHIQQGLKWELGVCMGVRTHFRNVLKSLKIPTTTTSKIQKLYHIILYCYCYCHCHFQDTFTSTATANNTWLSPSSSWHPMNESFGAKKSKVLLHYKFTFTHLSTAASLYKNRGHIFAQIISHRMKNITFIPLTAYEAMFLFDHVLIS